MLSFPLATEDPRRMHDALQRGEIVLVDVREPGGHNRLSTFDPAWKSAGLPTVK
jgi:hypothetical protein